MRFYPIDFIFIGCIGEDREFFWGGYPEISDFDPQTKYFHENVKNRLFEKDHFGVCDVTN